MALATVGLPEHSTGEGAQASTASLEMFSLAWKIPAVDKSLD